MKNDKSISIDKSHCETVGIALSEYIIRERFFKRPFLNLHGSREKKMLTYLFSAAICHQTYTLTHLEKNLFGWDFMEYAFINAFENESNLLNLDFLSQATPENIKNEIQLLFSTDGKPSSCTLDRLIERAEMLKQLAQGIADHPSKNVFEFLEVSKNGDISIESLYKKLNTFTAFEDPLYKKITFFVKLASNAKMLNIIDPQNIIPIMDYHMQRVLLRLGCINIPDEELKDALIKRKPIKSDKEVREACIDAIKTISQKSGHSILSMNDYFWPLGRSCCNEQPLCQSEKCKKDPCSLHMIVNIQIHNQCIFQNVCKGSKDENYRNFWQPIVETHYY